MTFDPVNPPKNLKPSEVAESWPTKKDAKPAVEADVAAQKPGVEEMDESTWREGDEEVEETPAQEEPAEEVQDDQVEAEEPAEVEAEAETEAEVKPKKKGIDEVDFSNPDEAKDYFKRYEKKKNKEIARLSRKNAKLKDSVTELTSTQREVVQLQKEELQRQRAQAEMAEQQQRFQNLVQEYVQAGYPAEHARFAAEQVWNRLQPARPSEEQQRLARIEKQLEEQRGNQMVDAYVKETRRTMKKMLQNHSVSDEQFEGFLDNALQVAAAGQIADPHEAVAKTLKPVLPLLTARKSVQRRPVGEAANPHRMIAQSGGTGAKQKGSSVSGKQPPKDAEQLEAEWGANEPW